MPTDVPTTASPSPRLRPAYSYAKDLKISDLSNELDQRIANLSVAAANQDASVANRLWRLRDTVQSTVLTVIGCARCQNQNCLDDNDGVISKLLAEKNRLREAYANHPIDENKVAFCHGRRLVQQRLREIGDAWTARKTEDIQGGVSSLSYLCSAMRSPSEGEVAEAIRKLRNNKAPREDGIPTEIFKSCVDTLAPWHHEVIERAWRDEVVPENWGLGILVPILKKGDKAKCENYRGISLIDVAAKIFGIVLLRRFQAVRDSRTRPNQAGFRAGRGCADQIFTLRHILEFLHSYQQPTAVCFIDFAAAFDSVHRESLWRIMALDGVPAKIIAMIKAHHRSTTARVLVRNNLSQPFGIRSGVRQGCVLSPILFNYAIDWILGRALRESDGVEFTPGHRLTDLDYADDIALLASSFGDLHSMVSRVNEVAKSVGLSINAGKTKVF
ncbi:hypothetical protein SprV_0602209800 [Sparganum proliferum]